MFNATFLSRNHTVVVGYRCMHAYRPHHEYCRTLSFDTTFAAATRVCEYLVERAFTDFANAEVQI